MQGAAVGAGFQLALACDLRVCSTDARFSMRETSLGLVPDLTGTHPLVRAVGYARALEICVTGRWVDAAEALSLGLATSVTEPEGLDDAVGRARGGADRGTGGAPYARPRPCCAGRSSTTPSRSAGSSARRRFR